MFDDPFAKERRERLKQMIVLGKSRGYLTYDEIYEHLPDDVQNSEQIDAIIGMIKDMGIEVRGEFSNLRTSKVVDKAAIIDDVEGAAKEKGIGVTQETAKILPFIKPDKNPV